MSSHKKPDDKPADSEPKRKGFLRRMLVPLLGVLIVGGGAGAGGYVYAQRSGPAKPAVPDVPKLVALDGHKAPEPTSANLAHADTFDRTKYKASYHVIEAPFTSNLKDSGSFIQVGIGVATYYDARVLDAVKAHETPLRSAILMRLSEQDAASLETPDGKAALQRALTTTINQTLRERTGFGGIDNVYFTSFVVQ